MAIEFACPACGASLSIPTAAGQTLQCPRCESSIQAPGASDALIPATALPAPPLPDTSLDFTGGVQVPDLRRKTRRQPGTWIAAALVAAIGAGVLFALLNRDRGPAPPRMRSPTAMRYLPDDFHIYFVGSYERLANMPAFRELERLSKHFNQQPDDDFLGDIGIEPANIRVVTGGFRLEMGSIAAVVETVQPLNSAEVEQKLRQLKFTSNAQASPRVYTGFLNNSSVSVCILDERTVLLGTVETVKNVLPRDRNARLSPKMRALMEQLDDSKAFMVAIEMRDLLGRPGARALIDDLGEQGQRFANELETAILYLDLNDQLEIDLELTCRTPETAEELRKLIEGLLVVGRLGIPADLPPQVTEIYDSIKFSNQGMVMRGTSRIQTKTLTELLDKLILDPRFQP
jgi:hypothetical protein